MTRLLTDSTSYFRLARFVRPLLGRGLGDPEFTLHVIAELDDEFAKSTRLVDKFYWVKEAEYVKNRSENRIGAEIDAFALEQTIQVMKHHKHARGLGVSKVDIVVLAISYQLGLAVISDDADVQEMAVDFDMPECMTSLDVLEWLYGEGVLSFDEVSATVTTWRLESDLPSHEIEFIQRFFELFQEMPW